MCCDTDGSGMHRLLCEPEPCLVRCAEHASSDTGADRCAIGDTAHASDTCAEPRADGSAECTADGSPEPAAFDSGGVGDEPAIDAADGGSDRGAHGIAEPHTERTADSSAEQCTVDVAEPRTDSGAAAAGRDMGADSELEADGCAGVCDADGAAVDGGAADTGTHTHTDTRADEGQDRP